MAGDVDGAQVLAKSLKDQGIEYAFGLTGIPVVETSFALQQFGIKFIAMRNEQSAAYAAQAMGYLTKKPAVCLTVSGPGQLHAMGGVANAQANCWPMILISGSADFSQEQLGAFQESSQVEAARLFTKFSARPPSIDRIPFFVQKAVKLATYGRPGPVYLDLPGDLLATSCSNEQIDYLPKLPSPPASLAPDSDINKAIELLQSAQRPLVIIGKGAAYARAEGNINNFIDATGLPFLPTAMGKGLISDTNPKCISPARSLALQQADVLLIFGARLNWMLHFGLPPRIASNVKIIQVDLQPEEFHASVPITHPLCGDLNSVSAQLLSKVHKLKWSFPAESEWFKQLSAKIKSNRSTVSKFMADNTVPLNYFAALSTVEQNVPKDSIIVNEGANTMDIGRTIFLHHEPRHRLDAGTYGTMGIGLGFAVAAGLYASGKNKRVVCIQGDSAFGFSAMEIETLFRYKLPVILVIINNNGIYGGLDEDSWAQMGSDGDLELRSPPTCLVPNTRYEKLAEMCGGQGFFCTTVEQIQHACQKAVQETEKPTVINIMINPTAQRKKQDFEWLTRSKM